MFKKIVSGIFTMSIGLVPLTAPAAPTAHNHAVPLGNQVIPKGLHCGTIVNSNTKKSIPVILTYPNSQVTCETALFVLDQLFNNPRIMQHAFKTQELGASGRGVVSVYDYKCDIAGYNVTNEDKAEYLKVGDTGCFKYQHDHPDFMGDTLHRWK